MSSTLTAQQLHELVNGEYTMPDGSKRRALWERVPDTRRRGLDIAATTMSLGRLMWHTDIPMPDEAAAALIRVAIQDWLVSQDGRLDLGQTHVDASPSVSWWCEWYAGGTQGETQRFTTRIHPVVAAAHAVADALGIPH